MTSEPLIPERGNGFAIAALALGITSATLALSGMSGVVIGFLPMLGAIVFGAIAIGEAKRPGGTRRHMALWGFWLGCGTVPVAFASLSLFAIIRNF